MLFRRRMGVNGVHSARRPDPVRAELRRRAGGVREASPGADPVRQRCRQQRPGQPRPRRSSNRSRASRSRALAPSPGTCRTAGGWGRKPAAGVDQFTWKQASASRHRLHRRHRRRPRRAVDGHAELPLGAESGRDRGLVPDREAHSQHGGGRRRRRAAVDQVLGARRRPPGDGHRGTPRRQGDLRPGRLAAGQRAQARAGQHPARIRTRPSAAPTPSRCPQAAGPSSPSRCTTRATSTARARGSGSSSARPTATSRSGRSPTRCRKHPADGAHRPLGAAAVQPHAAGRARGPRAHRPAAVPGPARRAVPDVRADGDGRLSVSTNGPPGPYPRGHGAGISSPTAFPWGWE